MSVFGMEPLISVQLFPGNVYQSGDRLRCHCQIDAIEVEKLHAIELSVLWFAEGEKGEEAGVVYFKRRLPEDALDGDLRKLWEFETTLPNHPLSSQSDGENVHWCVRVRVFHRQDKEAVFDYPFELVALRREEGTSCELEAGECSTDH